MASQNTTECLNSVLAVLVEVTELLGQPNLTTEQRQQARYKVMDCQLRVVTMADRVRYTSRLIHGSAASLDAIGHNLHTEARA